MNYLPYVVFKWWVFSLAIIQLMFFVFRLIALYMLYPDKRTSKTLNSIANIFFVIKKCYVFGFVELILVSVVLCITGFNPILWFNFNNALNIMLIYTILIMIQKVLTEIIQRNTRFKIELRYYNDSLKQVTLNGCTIIELFIKMTETIKLQ